MISAFGAAAQAYARGLPDLEAIVFDPAGATSAYLEEVRRREAGTPFYLMMIYEDPRCALIRAIAPQIFAQTGDNDLRLQIFQAGAAGQLNVGAGKSARDAWSETPEMLVYLGAEMFSLADAVLVRSHVQAQAQLPFSRRARPLEVVVAEPDLPGGTPRGGSSSVVVWARNRPAEELAFEAFALVDFLGPVTLVCATGTLPAFPAIAVVHADDPRIDEVLASAGVVVCPDCNDPGVAVAFARRGFRVAAPRQSGAIEFVPGAALYDGAEPRSLWEAVAIALARPVSRVRYEPPPRAPAVPPSPLPAAAMPRVSVIVPTHDRRDDVAAVLSCLAAQTYPNLDVLVVNDAGESVDDIVAQFPCARALNLTENGGATRAVMAGLDAVDGEYVQFLADDDWLYPDHVQRIVVALLASGAAAAHANTLIRYQERTADGRWKTVGFNATTFNGTATPSDALISTSISGQGMIVRRDVFEQIGRWRDDTFLADQEFQFRLWTHYPVVWIDHMTAEWRIRGTDNFSSTVDSAPELERLFADYHPVTNRPIITANRQATLENVRARPPGFVFPATVKITDPV